MLTIDGYSILRDGHLVGRIKENYLYDASGSCIGHYDDEYVYDENRNKLAYMEGDFLVQVGTHEHTKMPIETINDALNGSLIPLMQKCAIYMLIGA